MVNKFDFESPFQHWPKLSNTTANQCQSNNNNFWGGRGAVGVSANVTKDRALLSLACVGKNGATVAPRPEIRNCVSTYAAKFL
jgi:hypothetical protein